MNEKSAQAEPDVFLPAVKNNVIRPIKKDPCGCIKAESVDIKDWYGRDKEKQMDQGINIPMSPVLIINKADASQIKPSKKCGKNREQEPVIFREAGHNEGYDGLNKVKAYVSNMKTMSRF